MRLFFILSTAFVCVFAAMQPMKLLHISDGDTMIFDSGGRKVTCRLEGIDTPEKFNSSKMSKDSQTCRESVQRIRQAGIVSSQYAKQTLHEGQNYNVSASGKDKYGRTLCRVYAQAHIGGGVMRPVCFNTMAVEDGYAVVYKKGRFIKDGAFKRELLQAQEKAKRSNLGLWHNDYGLASCMDK